MIFSGRSAAFAATAAAAIAGGILSGCGTPALPSPSSSSSAAAVSQPGQAGLPPGQSGFTIHSSTTAFNSSQQSVAGSIEGEVDGLALTATSSGDPSAGGGDSCFFGTNGSSASGTLGGVPFTIQLASCNVSADNSTDTGIYTGDWGGRPVNITVTENLASDQARNGNDGGMGTNLPTFTGTIGSQTVSGSVTMPETFATGGTNQLTGTISVS